VDHGQTPDPAAILKHIDGAPVCADRHRKLSDIGQSGFIIQGTGQDLTGISQEFQTDFSCLIDPKKIFAFRHHPSRPGLKKGWNFRAIYSLEKP
jgi:hypothetical protein